ATCCVVDVRKKCEALAGLLLLIAILLFHIEQFEDKWYKSERIKYGFNHWNEVSLRLPRLRPVSSGSSNPMLTAEH
ncbi:uncharacterized protein DEA37_0004757, partial [Paragonimus westermani]